MPPGRGGITTQSVRSGEYHIQRDGTLEAIIGRPNFYTEFRD
jgi:hypothetical protein